MEEKKLTDEEIVKAFEDEKEFLLKEEKRTGNAPDTQLVYIRGEAVLKIIDLIHRLQDEKKELENLCNKTYDDLTKEIERLTEELEKTNAKLIEEYGKNAELQKQVDELKTEIKLEKEWGDIKVAQALADFEIWKQQAVKDTAKEILITAIQLSNMCRDFYEFQNRLVDLIEVNYGVKIVRETIIPAKGVEVE